MKYFYKIYGLTISSEIELPEAYEEMEQALTDVEIIIGTMPPFIKKKQEEHYVTSILHRIYKWFYFPSEGNFLIENGNLITVETDSTSDPEHIRAIILGACLGSILYQREILSIHGSAVVWNDKAIIISGVSGAGKSTLSSEFRKMGSLFLADDTVSIASENGIIYANPAYPQQKLCRDAAIRLGYDLESLILLQEECTKYGVRLKDTFCQVKKEVASFIYLDIHDNDQFIMDEISGSKKLELISSNIYGYCDLLDGGMNTNLFRKCLEMAQKVPVIKVIRPRNRNVSIAENIIQMLDRVGKF